MGRLIRCAVAGLGRIGVLFEDDALRLPKPCTHVGVYSSLKETELVAVCDSKQERCAEVIQRFGAKKGYTDFEEMLKQEEIDVLSVATPTPLHGEMVVKAAESGVRAVYCEKPIACSLKEADEMIQACRRNGTVLAVNHNRRWQPTFQFVKEHMEGLIGQLKFIVGSYPSPLARTGTHMLDLFNWYAGSKPKLVYGHTERENWLTRKFLGKTDYSGSGYILYENGVRAFLAGEGERSYLIYEVDLQGSDGRIRITDNGRYVEVWQARESEHYTSIQELAQTFRLEKRVEVNPMVNAVRNIIDALEHEDADLVECNGEDGWLSLQLALCIHASGTRGAPLNPDMLSVEYRIETY